MLAKFESPRKMLFFVIFIFMDIFMLYKKKLQYKYEFTLNEVMNRSLFPQWLGRGRGLDSFPVLFLYPIIFPISFCTLWAKYVIKFEL